ncbi:MAG: hypothetical protein ABI565_11445 [Vicinamibacteria bacterium]
MHTEPSKKASNPEIRYEKTDAHVRPLYQFLFWISVITLITAVFAMLVLRGLESWREKASTRPTMAEAPDNQQPPAPRLQIQEPKDLATFRKEEAGILSTYGVVDRDKGIYRMPIEEAMRITLERGVPTVGDSVPPVAPAKTPAKRPAKAARP